MTGRTRDFAGPVNVVVLTGKKALQESGIEEDFAELEGTVDHFPGPPDVCTVLEHKVTEAIKKVTTPPYDRSENEKDCILIVYNHANHGLERAIEEALASSEYLATEHPTAWHALPCASNASGLRKDHDTSTDAEVLRDVLRTFSCVRSYWQPTNIVVFDNL